MQIVGFNLSKMHIDRVNVVAGKFKVNSKIDIKDLKEEKVSPVQGKDMLVLDFEYNIEYEPKLAEIHFKGNLLILGDPKETKDMLSEWKKKGAVLNDIKIRVYNTIFHKCNLKALELEDDFGLPPHIQMPYIKTEEEKKASYTG